ncbi:MAG: carboxylesterase family protein [Eubacteriales bacterium]|nr:carboxylesterase family protein [Eubacteriales bacterium]
MKRGMKKLFCAATALMMVPSIPAFASGLIAENPAAAKTQPVVEVEGGKLIGFTRDDTYCFWGVDYAYADRFEQPQKVEPWEGYQFAQSYGTISYIPDQTAVGADEFVWPHRYWTQSDHCQNLNIWTQSLDPEAKKPVIVFFHGGGHTNGSSIESTAYDGQALSEYGDVVVVTVNHRLNTIGYLDLSSFGDKYEGSGNAGAADLAASLQWIHDNIAQFGGDPKNVTIFGQSGGGSKVATLMRQPATEGLFDAAGMISGGGVTISDNTNAKLLGERTVEILGLTEETIDEIQTIDYRTLLAAATQAQEELKEEGIETRWGPTADGVVVMDEFVTTDIPVIVSGVFSESAVSSYKYGDFRHHEWDEEETTEKLEERFGDKADELLAEFNKLYPEMEDREMYFYNNTMSGKWDIAEALTELGNTVYLYEFDYESPVNGGITAFHCEDLAFIFHNLDEPMVNIAYGEDPNAYIVQDAISDAFISLAYTGTPSTEELPWEAYESGSHKMMKFNVESGCVDHDTTAYTEILNAEE